MFFLQIFLHLPEWATKVKLSLPVIILTCLGQAGKCQVTSLQQCTTHLVQFSYRFHSGHTIMYSISKLHVRGTSIFTINITCNPACSVMSQFVSALANITLKVCNYSTIKIYTHKLSHFKLQFK